MNKTVQQIQLLGLSPLVSSLFAELASTQIEQFALFGGAVRDPDYAARHGLVRKVKDFDIRIWLNPNAYAAEKEQTLSALRDVFGNMRTVPAPGTAHLRYLFNMQGMELDVSLRPVPVSFQGDILPVEAVAVNRAGDSDIGISSVALAPDMVAWATPEYLQDRDNRTLTLYPIADRDRKQAYSARMLAKFPDHRLIDLS